MKKTAAILLLTIGVVLAGCAQGQGGPRELAESDPDILAAQEGTEELEVPETTGGGERYGGTATLEVPETTGDGERYGGTAALEVPEQSAATVAQSGPFGEIRIFLPPGWEYELCPAGAGGRSDDSYGIRFWPAGEEGYVELSYAVWFGVCGMGLSEETATIAGNKAYIGTYDNHAYWDFVTFEGDADGVVARTFSVENWWEEYGEQVLPILDTLRFDADVREESAQVAGEEEIPDFGLAPEIGLTLYLENITPTGATLLFCQRGGKEDMGELITGEQFILERETENGWERVVQKPDYAFCQVGWLIPVEEDVEFACDWEWLYGELPPGKYRMKKTVTEFGKDGNSLQHEICVQFLVQKPSEDG